MQGRKGIRLPERLKDINDTPTWLENMPEQMMSVPYIQRVWQEVQDGWVDSGFGWQYPNMVPVLDANGNQIVKEVVAFLAITSNMSGFLMSQDMNQALQALGIQGIPVHKVINFQNTDFLTKAAGASQTLVIPFSYGGYGSYGIVTNTIGDSWLYLDFSASEFNHFKVEVDVQFINGNPRDDYFTLEHECQIEEGGAWLTREESYSAMRVVDNATLVTPRMPRVLYGQRLRVVVGSYGAAATGAQNVSVNIITGTDI